MASPAPFLTASPPRPPSLPHRIATPSHLPSFSTDGTLTLSPYLNLRRNLSDPPSPWQRASFPELCPTPLPSAPTGDSDPLLPSPPIQIHPSTRPAPAPFSPRPGNGERGAAAQRQQRRGWLARGRARACFDAQCSVELAGPRVRESRASHPWGRRRGRGGAEPATTRRGSRGSRCPSRPRSTASSAARSPSTPSSAAASLPTSSCGPSRCPELANVAPRRRPTGPAPSSPSPIATTSARSWTTSAPTTPPASAAPAPSALLAQPPRRALLLPLFLFIYFFSLVLSLKNTQDLETHTRSCTKEEEHIGFAKETSLVKVSLHCKACAGKVKKHLAKMEVHGCNSGKKIMAVCIIKHTMAIIHTVARRADA